MRILTYHQVPPSFLDFVLAFKRSEKLILQTFFYHEHYLRERQFFTLRGETLELNLNADDAPERTQVPLEHARWFAGLASQLSVEQLRRAFEAGGATPKERDGFADAVRARIALLQEQTTIR